MFMIVKKSEEADGVAVVKCESSEKLARELVKQIAKEEKNSGLSSVRATAFDLKTGRTVAGPGMLGAQNGKTSKRKAAQSAPTSG